jgi:hypothetical protein
VRQDRDRQGGGLITYVKENIKFTQINTALQGELEVVTTRLHLGKRDIDVANLYIPPFIGRHEDDDPKVLDCFNKILNENTIVTADVNANSTSWYSPYTDHRGEIIEDLINDTDHIIINANTPTRIPFSRRATPHQQTTSPDITAIPLRLMPHTSWKTITKLASDHIPIITTINTHKKTKPNLTRTFINYKKAKWDLFKQQIEDKLTEVPPPDEIHKATKYITKVIRDADQKHIPRGSIKPKGSILPSEIKEKITQRNDLRKRSPNDQSLPVINDEITRAVRNHKRDLWVAHINKDWNHKINTSILHETIKKLQGKQSQTESNRTITFQNKTKITDTQIADAFTKQYTGVTPKVANRQNRITTRQTKKIPHEQITITTEDTQLAINRAPNKKSLGPDKIATIHLKNLGPIAVASLTKVYNAVVNSNIIPSYWKLARLVPIHKPGKDKSQGLSYRPISILSPIAKTLEKIVLTKIQQHIPAASHQHGYKKGHSTVTALKTITGIIARGFNQKLPPQRTVLVSLDMSKAFDTVDHHQLIRKLHTQTTIPGTFRKFLANYMQGRKGYTVYNGKTSRQRNFRSGVPQGGVLSPTLFNIYMADIPQPRHENMTLTTYADDINFTTTHVNVDMAARQSEAYLNIVNDWTKPNHLRLNADKTLTTLFTSQTAQYNHTLNIHLEGNLLRTEKNPKILGVTFDPGLTFNKHAENTKVKGKRTLNILKQLTGTDWGKHKETLTATYKTYTRPILEYASPVWSSMISKTNMGELQIVQNAALRVSTGQTKDTNIQYLHDETLVLPLKTHTRLLASQLREKATVSTHPLHNQTNWEPRPRKMKDTIFNSDYTTNIQKCPNNHVTQS